MNNTDDELAAAFAAHVKKLLVEGESAPLPPKLQESDAFAEMRFVHDYLTHLRLALDDISQGRLSTGIPLQGFIGGALRNLQDSLLHLTQQIQQVGSGDFSCQIDFWGEFSLSFNNMVAQLNAALTALRQNEVELTRHANKLKREVVLKGEELTALTQSEANFKYMASHDPLTGVLNRRSFFDTAMLRLREACIAGEHCCVVLFDLDDFKSFNDRYGHLDGDEALRHVTDIVSASLRKNDLIGRYGGEEFACLFPLLDAEGGKEVAERMQRKVARQSVCTRQGEARLTISIGYLGVPPDTNEERSGMFWEKVLRQTDEYLYKAKRNGKNRVEGGVYQPEEAEAAVNPS